ncbi:16S rRNA (guanine(527)-N(7))-methyltransferase RsmG [Sphingomonas sp. I4]
MTEEQARDWVVERFGEEAAAQIDYFLNLVIVENDQQNLIAPSTISTIWARHALDSVQLIPLADRPDGQWVDIGTGGGFPGMVVALAWPGRMALVEPRKRRADFLRDCAERLGVADRVTVHASKIEAVDVKADVISARAVATVENLCAPLSTAAHRKHGGCSRVAAWTSARSRPSSGNGASCFTWNIASPRRTRRL